MTEPRRVDPEVVGHNLMMKSWSLEAYWRDMMTESLAEHIKDLRGGNGGMIRSYRKVAEALYTEMPVKPDAWYPDSLQSAGSQACAIAAEFLGEHHADWI